MVDVKGYLRMMRLSVQPLECIPLCMVIEGSRRNIDIDGRMQGWAKDKEAGRGISANKFIWPRSSD